MHGENESRFAGQQIVNKDRLKGSINEVAGRAKRQVGEWTGDTNAQIEGLAQEVKGKVQKAWGGVKETVRTAQDHAKQEQAQLKTEKEAAEKRERHDARQQARKQ
jgi:uncharacterized protein YjbJ (UPF0337 family)